MSQPQLCEHFRPDNLCCRGLVCLFPYWTTFTSFWAYYSWVNWFQTVSCSYSASLYRINVCCGMFISNPGLHSLDASSIHLSCCHNQNRLQNLPNVLWGPKSPQLRWTALDRRWFAYWFFSPTPVPSRPSPALGGFLSEKPALFLGGIVVWQEEHVGSSTWQTQGWIRVVPLTWTTFLIALVPAAISSGVNGSKWEWQCLIPRFSLD